MSHSCEKELQKSGKDTGFAQEGDKFKCSCGAVYIHICDEAEGCCWVRQSKAKVSAHD